jgi:hypothetical protein
MSGQRGKIELGIRAGSRVLTAKFERRLARLAPQFNPSRKDYLMNTTITDWKGARSGAGITIAGKDAAGNPVKVSVTTIVPRKGKVLGIAAGGQTYELEVA